MRNVTPETAAILEALHVEVARSLKRRVLRERVLRDLERALGHLKGLEKASTSIPVSRPAS